MRLGLSRAGIAWAIVYAGLGTGWLVFGHPPGDRFVFGIWFGALIVIELMIPGAANQVTLARAYLAAPAFAYASQGGGFGLLALTIALAGLSDLVDGTVARRFDKPTQFGGGLDPVVDGIFFGAVAVGLAVGGAYPAWLAAVVVGRYALPAAVGGLLLVLGRPPQLKHTLFGQVSTAVNAVLLGWIALFRGLGQDAGPVVSAAEVVIPLAAAGSFAHLFWANRESVTGGTE